MMNKLKINFLNGNYQTHNLDNIYKTELTEEYLVVFHDKGRLDPDVYYRSHIEKVSMY